MLIDDSEFILITFYKTNTEIEAEQLKRYINLNYLLPYFGPRENKHYFCRQI